MQKTYLGDGIYCEWVGEMFCLTTENGIETTNTIYLDPEVATAFIRYAALAGIKG